MIPEKCCENRTNGFENVRKGILLFKITNKQSENTDDFHKVPETNKKKKTDRKPCE